MVLVEDGVVVEQVECCCGDVNPTGENKQTT